MDHKLKRISTSLLTASMVASALSGCAGYKEFQNKVDDDMARQQANINRSSETFFSGGNDARMKERNKLVRDEGIAWVGSKSIPKEKTDKLPPQFDAVTLNFVGRHTIASVAEIIQKATSLKVMIHPDVLIPFDSLAPINNQNNTANNPSSQNSQVATNVASTMSAPTTIVQSGGGIGSAQTSAGGNYYVDVPVTYVGSLGDFLDRIATRLGVDWEFKDGKIEIRRFITRTYRVLALPGSTEFTSELGKSGGVSSGASTGSSGGGGSSSGTGTFSARTNVSSTAKMDYWKDMEATIRSMMSSRGKVAINQGTGAVTVTDIRDIVQRVGQIIDEENRTMSRQVAFEVQTITVRTTDASAFGIDWNLVYKKLSNLTPDWSVSLATPGSVTNANSGSLSLGVLHNVSGDDGLLNRMTGSTALVKALAEVVKVTNVTTQRAITVNRQAVPLAATDQQAYVAQTTPSASTSPGATATTVGLTPGIVTTGFVMNMIPTITDKNSILLTLSADISELRGIPTFSSGSGVTQQSIQLPQVSSNQFIQRLGLKSGDSLVISGFENQKKSYTKRTLDNDVEPGVGGSFDGNGVRESTIMVITPILMDSI